MNKLFITLLFIYYASFGQTVQHEPRKLFVETLNVSENIRNSNEAFKRFALMHNLKRVVCLRNGQISSDINLDKNGNVIVKIENENTAVSKSEYKYDKEGRVAQETYYSPNGNISYGYYLKYNDGIEETYRLSDSILFARTTNFKERNSKMYSRYDGLGKLESVLVLDFDNRGRYELETRFSEEINKVQYRYEYIENEKYVTKIEFDQNGEIFNETRHLRERKLPNERRINFYSEQDKSIFRSDFFDESENFVKMELYDSEGKKYRAEVRKYNGKNQLKRVIKENYDKHKRVEYKFTYDKKGRLKLVKKRGNGNKEKFLYEYEYY